MPAFREQPYRFVPRGVSDTVDGDNSPAGAMTALSNLQFDPSTPSVFVCRPANTQLTNFPGFTTPGIISVAKVLDGVVYGMIGSASPAGKDRPFAYDILSNSFKTIAGVTSSNCPTTQVSTGDWTPPAIDSLGSKIIITHPGFNYAGGYAFGYIDISGFTATPTGTTAVGSNVITAVTSTAGISPGFTITGAGIPVGSTVVNISTTTITISANATAAAAVTLTIAGGTPAAPLWCAGNTTGNLQLAAAATNVNQFSNRAYFSTGNSLVFTDTLSLNVSNAGSVQVLTVGDSTKITALAGLPEYTSSTGVLQALLVFKSFSIWQVNGDAALNNLALNSLIDGVGTSAPRSVQVTARGVTFAALDGIRNIGFTGEVSEVDQDLAVPFIYAAYPSRIAACFNSGAYRICTQNTNTLGSPYEDYHLNYKYFAWTGPHTFRFDMASAYLNDFILFRNDIPGTMWRAYSVQNRGGLGNSFVENGTQLTWSYQTAPLSDIKNMYNSAAVRSTIDMALPSSGDTYTFQAIDVNFGVVAIGKIVTASSRAVWGAYSWGDGTLWGAQQLGLFPATIPWTRPLVFNKLVVQGKGNSALGLRIGALWVGNENLGYLNP